jgi:hypothetical protein
MSETEWQDVLRDYVEAGEPPLALGFDAVTAAIGRDRRRRVVLGGVIATTAAMGIAVVMVAATAGAPAAAPGSRLAGGAPTAPVSAASAPAMIDVAYVRTSATAALARTTDRVLRTEGTSGGGRFLVRYTDRGTGKDLIDGYRAGRETTAVLRKPGRPDQTFLTVDYTDKTWSTTKVRFDQPIPEPVSYGPYADPSWIREALRTDEITLLGTDEIGGVKALRLRLGEGIVMWVAEDSYLPLKAEIGSLGVVLTYAWLPRTPANLAKVTLVPPPGFTEIVAPSPGPATGN